MRLVQIAGGKVVNASIAAPDQDVPEGWIASDDAQIGWDVVDGVPVSPPPRQPGPAPIPDLTFAQLMIGLVAEGWITEAEGDAWLTGTLPAAASALIDTLPEGQRFAAKARAVRPSVVLRADPLVNTLGAAQGKTPEQMDAFFTTYAQV